MALPKLTKLELQIMEALWTRGPCSIREIQESFPAKKRPAYTTVQTMVYRLEVKKALRRVKKIATAFIFEAAVSREALASGVPEGQAVIALMLAVPEEAEARFAPAPDAGWMVGTAGGELPAIAWAMGMERALARSQ